MTKFQNINIWLFFATILELYTLTIGHEWYNSNFLPILFVFSGLSIILLPLVCDQDPSPTMPKITLWAFLILLLIYIIYRVPLIFQLIPVDYRVADMLPVMQTMAERWFTGGPIYEPIQEIWGGIVPVYLPALWLPILPAEFLDFDLRWMGACGLIGMILCIIFLRDKNPSLAAIALVLLPLGLFVFWHVRFQLNTISLSNEEIVFFYYAILGFAIAREKYWLIGVALSLCLLSRYYIGTWAIMILTAYFYQLRLKHFVKIIFILSIATLALITLAQAWTEIPRFLDLPNHYLNALMLDPDKYQPLIEESLSLARYFDYAHIPTIHRINNVLMWVIPALLLFYYWKNKVNLDFRLFALISMKSLILVFFALMTMPYHYLYSTSFVVSLCILSYISNAGKTEVSSLEKNYG